MDYANAAVLSDLDGTLFNSRGGVCPEDLAAIRELIAAGGLFGLATGRAPGNIRDILPDLPLNGPSIVLNGAAVYDFGAGAYLGANALDAPAALSLVEHCLRAALPLDIQVYTADGICYATPLESAEPGFLRIHQPAVYMSLAALAQRDWFKLVLLERTPGALGFMRSWLQQTGSDARLDPVEGTTDVVQAGYYLEILPKGVNKGSAVPSLRGLPAYRDRTLFAAGDYWNDMELLRAVDVPCAPDNAIPEIKAVCRHVLPSHNDGAIAALIREVIPAL